MCLVSYRLRLGLSYIIEKYNKACILISNFVGLKHKYHTIYILQYHIHSTKRSCFNKCQPIFVYFSSQVWNCQSSPFLKLAWMPKITSRSSTSDDTIDLHLKPLHWPFVSTETFCEQVLWVAYHWNQCPHLFLSLWAQNKVKVSKFLVAMPASFHIHCSYGFKISRGKVPGLHKTFLPQFGFKIHFSTHVKQFICEH